VGGFNKVFSLKKVDENDLQKVGRVYQYQKLTMDDHLDRGALY